MIEFTSKTEQTICLICGYNTIEELKPSKYNRCKKCKTLFSYTLKNKYCDECNIKGLK